MRFDTIFFFTALGNMTGLRVFEKLLGHNHIWISDKSAILFSKGYFGQNLRDSSQLSIKGF